MNDDALLYLIFCKTRLLLSKRHYDDWRQIQSEFADYMTSLGPWTAVQIVDYFPLDYGDDDERWPFTRGQILAFMRSDCETLAHHTA